MTAILSPFGTGGGVGTQAWQFQVSTYGAKGNGKVITDATMLASSSLLNSPSQAQFTSADIGKSIVMSCTGATLYTAQSGTITGVNSSTQAVVSFTSVNATLGASYCCYATDDTAAVTSALAAALAYSQSHNGYAEILFANQIYGIAGPAVIGSGTGGGNAQIRLPVCSTTAMKQILVFTTLTKGYDQALMHWLQTTPQSAGAVLACLRTDGTNDGTYGPASMIGGPFNGYGGSLGLFSNCMPVVDGVQMLFPYNSTYGGWDFFGMAEAQVISTSQMTMATVPAAPPYPNITNANNIGNTWTFGVRMPCTGNNDRSDVLYHSAEGMCYGLMPSEHSSVESIREIYNVIGLEGYSGNGVAMPHAARVKYASLESNAQSMGFFDGIVNLDADTVDSENGANLIYDPTSKGVGTICLRDSAGYFTGGVINGGSSITVRMLDQKQGPVSGPHAAPASGSPWANGYFRDAWITLLATTITGVTITGPNSGTAVAQNISGTPTTYTFLLPSGCSYTPTYTGTLTHTVTLI